MSTWVAFILGLIGGWVIEWVIDWAFWRRDETTAVDGGALHEQIAQLQAENGSLQQRLQAALNREPEVIVKEVKVVTEKDDLKKIKGVGAVFAGKFNDAGVYTFADVGALSPERIEVIISPEEWQAIDPASWISQAQQLAQGREHIAI